MKVYTKTGDHGTTLLIGGERVAKTDLRVEAYGSVDELMAFVALLGDTLRVAGDAELYIAELNHINATLMSVAANLAIGNGGDKSVKTIDADLIGELELSIDKMQEALPAITKFTLPGGHRAVSMCHVCRTVCRRAERAALRASAEYLIRENALVYLNRLSDYFYLLGRTLTEFYHVKETLWIP